MPCTNANTESNWTEYLSHWVISFAVARANVYRRPWVQQVQVSTSSYHEMCLTVSLRHSSIRKTH